MRELFKVVPPNLFRPLAAPGAPVYARALFVLFDATRRHQQPLSRDLALSLVMEILSDPEVLDAAAAIQDEFEETDDQGEEFTDEPGRIQARSSALLRTLARHGWLRVETQSDFSQQYILPDYAFRLLETLEVIAANEPPPLRGMIYGIHDLLQMALKDGDEHIRIPQAHRQMQRLMNGLKELQHNIGAHIEGVLQRLQASQILEQFFTNYRQEIVDRVYHQLRTTDHVARFRLSALDALAKIEREGKLLAAASRLRAGGEAESVESAAQRLLEQMREISEDLLTDETGAANRPLPEQYRRLVSSFERGLVDESSLAPPKRAAVAFVPEGVATPSLSDEEIAEARRQTLRSLARAISRDRVRRFAAELLRHSGEVRGGEIHIEGPDDLPLLIYLRNYGDGSLGYRVEESENAEWIERDGVGFRDFVIRKSEVEQPEPAG